MLAVSDIVNPSVWIDLLGVTLCVLRTNLFIELPYYQVYFVWGVVFA